MGNFGNFKGINISDSYFFSGNTVRDGFEKVYTISEEYLNNFIRLKMEASDYCIVSTTTDSKDNADTIAKILLEKKLIACAQQTVTQSAYRWQGKIIESDEILIQMKTKKSLFEQIKKEIKALHTYEVPEIIMIPLLDANHFYLEWIEKETIKI